MCVNICFPFTASIDGRTHTKEKDSFTLKVLSWWLPWQQWENFALATVAETEEDTAASKPQTLFVKTRLSAAHESPRPHHGAAINQDAFQFYRDETMKHTPPHPRRLRLRVGVCVFLSAEGNYTLPTHIHQLNTDSKLKVLTVNSNDLHPEDLPLRFQQGQRSL